MKPIIILCSILGLLGGVWGEEPVGKEKNNLTASQSQTVKQETKKICFVLTDFTCVETKARGRFLHDETYAVSLEMPSQQTLLPEDRKSVNSIMQGFVRLLDTWNNSQNQELVRDAKATEWQQYQQEKKEMFQSFITGDRRTIVLGADYLGGYLTSNDLSKVFSIVSPEQVQVAMLENQDQPLQVIPQLIAKNGATHLIYGTVGDLAYTVKEFEGYGIKTKITDYSLDVMIKVVDLSTGAVVYANNYTGTFREKAIPKMKELSSDIYAQMMKQALQKCAQDLFQQTKGEQPVLVRPPQETMGKKWDTTEIKEEK